MSKSALFLATILVHVALNANELFWPRPSLVEWQTILFTLAAKLAN